MKKPRFIFLIFILILFTACSVPHAEPTPVPTDTPEPTETPIPEPTPTIPPSAAVVNGIYIALDDLDAKKQQLRDGYEQVEGSAPGDSELREEALQDLIDETLFLSAARKSGLAPSAEELDARTQSLCDSMGGCDALRDWQTQNHYNEESFRRALERETAASNMRSSIFERLKDTEQLHVYRIWSYQRSDLDNVMNRLNMGVSFIDLAKNYDEATGGDMSWFPRGVLFSKDVEDKIFGLNAGEHTEIIETAGVYNIFYVAEKQTGRAMDLQVEQISQRRALADWLEEQKQQAEIEFL